MEGNRTPPESSALSGPRRTFGEIRRRRNLTTLALFSLLTAFYFGTFTLIWLPVRLGVHAWTARLAGYRAITPGDLAVLFLLAFFLAAIHWYTAVETGPGRILRTLRAGPPDPEDRHHQMLRAVTEEMKLAAGLPRVEVVVLPVTAVNALAMEDLSGRAVIGVTEGMLALLPRNGLRAVVAHEMAHLQENDALLVTLSCSLFAVLRQMYEVAEHASDRRGGSFLLLPVLGLATVGSHVLNVLISRQREHLADAMAVRLTRDPDSLEDALWRMRESWRGNGFIADDLSPLFFADPADTGLSWREDWLADLFATHPPLARRIEALQRIAGTGRKPLRRGERRVPSPPGGGEAPEDLPEAVPAAPVAGDGPPPGDRWLAFRNGTWEGPFTAEALWLLPWFTALSLVRGEGDTATRQARGVPEVMAAVSSSAVAGKGDCPLCRVHLVPADYEGVRVRRCPTCRGVLLRQDQDLRILIRREKTFSEAARRKAEDFRAATQLRPAGRQDVSLPDRRCPDCRRPMRRRIYSYQFFVEVERCPDCGLTWFDGGELEIIQILVEREEGRSR